MIDRPKRDAQGRVSVPDEDEFIQGANQAIRRAIEATHQAGFATTHARDGKLVEVFPDGHVRELGPLRRP
ncbi:MAG TPA: hypothetical protein PLW65_06525 [Pseudomonadota bacterium]|nr:hypothetical protein [Pseudomonadota bacterium]